jgi:ADP-heptose:LPS heptosyltransferase
MKTLPKILAQIRPFLFTAMDLCFTLIPVGPGDGGVLIIRTDGIGDFVVWIDAARALVRHYRGQGKRVTLLASSTWAEWARELNLFDAVISIDRQRLNKETTYRARTELALRRNRFSVTLQPIYSRHYYEDMLAYMTGAKELIGWLGDMPIQFPRIKRIRDRWYTRMLSVDPLHNTEIIRNADFVRQLADTSYVAKMSDLRSYASTLPIDQTTAAAKGVFYVLFPGTSWEGKRWPVAHFTELSQRIYKQTGWSGMVCGGREDQEFAAELVSASTAPLLNITGKTSISQLTLILSRARFLVANDTGAAHIAASVGTPVVCLLGGGHYGRFFPYQIERKDDRPLPAVAVHPLPCFNCDWKCIFPREKGDCVPCIREISVDDVWQLLDGIVHLARKKETLLPLQH